MPSDLTTLPILITGASSGIGRAAAIACARAGMPVVLAARRADKLADAVREIESRGGRALAFECDVADAAQCRAAVEACVEKFGSIYSVFANAGYGQNAAVHEMTDADLRRMFEVNLFGTTNVVNAALKHMLPARRGHVLICSSCLARMPIMRGGAYSATKAAQHHLARAMRLELAPLGVCVSSVHPIGTRTEFFDVAAGAARGDGASTPPPSMFMQDASFVADCVVRCLRRPKPEAEVWPGMMSKLLRVVMAGLVIAPGIGDWMMRRAERR
ncbi:MAG: SDR family NAD(P)-dependent oxidoreductase [Phycisphaerales bacterium]